MTQEELNEILRLHRLWLAGDENGERAILYDADLYGADLCDTNLCGANLYGANLRGVYLRGADLRDAILSPKEQIRKGIIVEREMTGWKKCKEGVIVKLEIPNGAVVFSINNKQCRTNVAKVIEVIGAKEGISKHDEKFIYEKGKTLKVDNFDLMYNAECSTGIHFFRTRKEAENYE